MARAQQDIYNGMLADHAADPTLSVKLTNGSNFSIYRLIYWIVAAAIRLHELVFDAFVIQVAAIAARAVPGTAAWYQAQCFYFQYGDAIELINGAPAYAVIDATKNVVNQAAVINVGNGVLLFKVAYGIPGAMAPIPDDQKAGLLSFLNKIKDAGDEITILSLNGDQLQVTGTYYYDPQYALADVKASVDAIGNGYIQAQLLSPGGKPVDFNGYFYNSKFETALEGCLGYKDIELDNVQGSPDGGVTWIDIIRVYNPTAGYLVFNTPLSEQLTFVPFVG